MAVEGQETGLEAATGVEPSAGMPQLDFATFPSQIFWLIVALVALYYILSKVALPRIAAVIEERHDAIEDDLERAAQFRRKAAEAERHYEEARAEARREAGEIAAKTRAEIQKELDVALAKADAEIAARTAESERRIGEIREGARASIEQVAVEVAEALVEALAPGAAEPEAARGAVAKRLQG